MVAAAFCVGLAVTLAVIGPLVGLLRRWQVLDIPNARSSHMVAVPRGGGLAVLAGLYAGAVTSRILYASDWRAATQVTTTIALAVAMLSALGLADDIRHLAAAV